MAAKLCLKEEKKIFESTWSFHSFVFPISSSPPPSTWPHLDPWIRKSRLASFGLNNSVTGIIIETCQ